MTKTAGSASRPAMSDRLQAVRKIYDCLQKEHSFTLAKARRAYREAFDVPPDDESIDKRFLEIFEYHLGYPLSGRLHSWCAEDIAVPADIALAFFLREIPGRTLKTPRIVRMAQLAQMEEFVEQLAEVEREGQNRSSEEAQWEAARRVHRTFEWRGQRGAVLSIKQMVEWSNHPKRYGLNLPSKRRQHRKRRPI